MQNAHFSVGKAKLLHRGIAWFIGSILIVLLIPTPPFAKPPRAALEARVAALEAALSVLQNDLAALQSGQSTNTANIAANASAIAVHAAAIAANAAAAANNSSAITALDSRTTTNESNISSLIASLSSLEARVAILEQSSEENIPIYTDASALPTDGSVHVALFQPDNKLVGPLNGEVIADQWLMVFDGVSTALSWPAEDGSAHQFPVGWYPAGSGASYLEGVVPVAALTSLYLTLDRLKCGECDSNPPIGDETIGERMQILAIQLSDFYTTAVAAP